MTRAEPYTDLKGRPIFLTDLDPEELALVDDLRNRAESHPDWNDFENYWTQAVGSFYDARGVPRVESRRTAVYRIAEDLGGRLAVEAGLASLPDYRDDLERLIQDEFSTRREFCAATGLSEDMLSHVLAHRKQFGIDTLAKALDRIGYQLRITREPGRTASKQ